MRDYPRTPLELRDPQPPAGPADPWLFAPQNNFGCGGRSRPFNEVYEDYPTETVWQPDAYAEAADLAHTIDADEVVDFGCGSGEKLRHFFASGSRRLVGVDFRGSMAYARSQSSAVEWTDCNLGLWSDLAAVAATFSSRRPRVLIASDVIEHLSDPRPLVGTLRQLLLQHPASRLILTTPDRHRMHGAGADGIPTNVCHAREWRLEELHQALVASGFVIHRLGFTRSNLEDDSRRTAFLELSASPESYDAFLERIDFLGGCGRSRALRLPGLAEDCDLLQQALFFVPDLRDVTVPASSIGERRCQAASAAGLLPATLNINGRRFTLPADEPPSEVSVALVVRNLRLAWLSDCIAALNNQSIAPSEILIVAIGSRLDYRFLLAQHMFGRSRVPCRTLHSRDLASNDLVARVMAATTAPFVALFDGPAVPLMDFLSITTRFLTASADAAEAVTDAALLLEDHESAVTPLAPGDPARRCVPRVIKRALVATGTTDHRIPVVACLVRPSAGATEPPHGTAAAFWRWFRARARRLVRGPRVRT